MRLFPHFVDHEAFERSRFCPRNHEDPFASVGVETGDPHHACCGNAILLLVAEKLELSHLR